MSSYTNSEYLELSKLLSSRMKSIPAWKELSDAMTEVYEREIEKPRRRLSRNRDTLVIRKDEIIKNLEYIKGNVYDAEGNSIVIAKGTKIRKGEILKIIMNGETNVDEQDYAIVRFELDDGKTYLWNMPITAPQERSLVIQNAALLGFNFFNTELDNEDYHRIQEFIAQYWPQGGTKNLVRFLSFIKNIRLEMGSLYSYDENTDDDTFPVLENEDYKNNPPAEHRGKEWYKTSHVELRYDPFADIANTQLDIIQLQEEFFSSIEKLFYYLAPIHLVLDRVITAVNMYGAFFSAIAGQELQEYKAKWAWETPDWISDLGITTLGQAEYSVLSKCRWVWPSMFGQFKTTPLLHADLLLFGQTKYQTPDQEVGLSYLANTAISIFLNANYRYVWPVMAGEWSQVFSSSIHVHEAANVKYIYPDMEIPNSFSNGFFIETFLSEKTSHKPIMEVERIFPGFFMWAISKFTNKVSGSYYGDDGEDFYGIKFPFYTVNLLSVRSNTSTILLFQAKNPGLTPIINDLSYVANSSINLYYSAKVAVRR